MPTPPDDDAPRWEPAPSTEAPRWEPAAAAEIPRWQPERERSRRPPPAAESRGARPAPVTRPVRAAPVPLYAWPFVWWSSHPWVVVWALVLLIPGAAVVLRLLDESERQASVRPLAVGFVVLLVAALVLGARASARRSAVRLALGVGGSVAAAGLLGWAVTQITFGRTACPPRAGPDLGASVAAGALAAWSQRTAGDAAWRNGRADTAWTERARSFSVLDYRLVDSGCWERVAPVDGRRTWHEFRVTVRPSGNEARLSKTVVIHAVAGADGWKITGIEGPLP